MGPARSALLRAYLHGGGGPQVGVVIRPGGVKESGGSRGGAWVPPPPSQALDVRAPPYLKVWIRRRIVFSRGRPICLAINQKIIKLQTILTDRKSSVYFGRTRTDLISLSHSSLLAMTDGTERITRVYVQSYNCAIPGFSFR